MDTTPQARNLHYIFVKSELGAGTYGASLGPDSLRLYALQQEKDYFERHPAVTLPLDYEGITAPVKDPHAWHIEYILTVYQDLSARVSRTLDRGFFPFLLTGDHSSAGGVIAGIKDAHPDKRLGVVWIDAHGDLHTPHTSPTGNMHGMPLGTALGLPLPEGTDVLDRTIRRWEQLINLNGLRPKLRPEDLFFLGIRDLEQPEWDVISGHDIPYLTVEQVREKGAAAVVDHVLETLSDCDEIYLSFDTDSLDDSLVPGTGTPVPNGFTLEEAEGLLTGFWDKAPLVGLEFTEVNPMLDAQNRTVGHIFQLMEKLLTNR